MFISYRLLKKKLSTADCLKLFFNYVQSRRNMENARNRTRFLKKCLENDLIPKFLAFRVPENGCFENSVVHNFQKRLLRREVAKANEAQESRAQELELARNTSKGLLLEWLVPSVVLHTRRAVRLSSDTTRKYSCYRRDKNGL